MPRGGKRQGAGRKETGRIKRKISITLLPAEWEQIESLEYASMSEFLRDVLKKAPIIKRRSEFDLRSRLIELQDDKYQQLSRIKKLEPLPELAKAKVMELKRHIDDKETLDFFLEHLGLVEDNLCLAMRLDYRWQKRLKDKGVLTYHDDNYTTFVRDLPELIADYKKRLKREFRVYWEVGHSYGISPDYRNKISLSDLYYRGDELIQRAQEHLKEIEAKIEDTKKAFYGELHFQYYDDCKRWVDE